MTDQSQSQTAKAQTLEQQVNQAYYDSLNFPFQLGPMSAHSAQASLLMNSQPALQPFFVQPTMATTNHSRVVTSTSVLPAAPGFAPKVGQSGFTSKTNSRIGVKSPPAMPKLTARILLPNMCKQPAQFKSYNHEVVRNSPLVPTSQLQHAADKTQISIDNACPKSSENQAINMASLDRSKKRKISIENQKVVKRRKKVNFKAVFDKQEADLHRKLADEEEQIRATLSNSDRDRSDKIRKAIETLEAVVKHPTSPVKPGKQAKRQNKQPLSKAEQNIMKNIKKLQKKYKTMKEVFEEMESDDNDVDVDMEPDDTQDSERTSSPDSSKNEQNTKEPNQMQSRPRRQLRSRTAGRKNSESSSVTLGDENMTEDESTKKDSSEIVSEEVQISTAPAITATTSRSSRSSSRRNGRNATAASQVPTSENTDEELQPAKTVTTRRSQDSSRSTRR